MRFSFAPALLLVALSSAFAAPAERPVSFNRDVRPILSDKCFACHGFDAKHREAGLRLDTAEGAYADNDGTRAIVPGDPAKSEAWLRIVSTDKDDLMPPPKSHKTLTGEEKAVLKRWIEQGAKYQKHWAFETPVKSGLANSIDGYIGARLKEEGLTRSPEADRETLIRRVSFALTGLPPTVREVDDFLGDEGAGAYARMVDRYLASPRFGEEMAKHWLDVARYGDTHGLHLDNERSMWPYRDWVVRAFNDNLRFDQFTRWQLAGDLLPKPTRDQQIASGFNRCNVTTSEGGAINEEFQFRYAVERTSATVEAWMGLTAGCAVCHDHKFDPLSQKEFYALYAFFNSAADPAMDGNILLTPPILRLASPGQSKQLAGLEKDIAGKQQRIRDAIAQLDYTDPAEQTPPPPVRQSEEVWFDDAFPAGVKVEVAGGPATRFISAKEGAVHSGELALTRMAKGLAYDFFTTGANLEIPPNAKIAVWCYLAPQDAPRAVMLQFHTAGWNHRASWGEEGVIPLGKVRTPEHQRIGALPEPGEWRKLEFPAERLGLKPGMKVTGFAFTQMGGTVSWDRLSISSRVDPAKDPQWSWKVWAERNQGKRVAELPNDLQTLVRGKKAAEWTPEERKRVQHWWFENEYQDAPGAMKTALAEKLALESKRTALENAIPATLIMADLPQERESFVMARGQYDKPGEKVVRGTPAVFPPLPKREHYTRLDLADWLLSPQHPLTTRVAVNRLWQQFFGTGLVKTSGDFGAQGEPPSHPELLDWLAVDFRESGWDVKRLVRAFVTSATFRQASLITPEALKRDPENRLYARGPRFRLDAEQLRDNALFVSGLIDLQMGGKGVRPYQPPNIWEPVGFGGSNTRFYTPDKGPALYRRSLYTFLKRTAPPPFLANFDAPNREQSCARRERSNTPLQALQLMNDVQHFEAARAFAERIVLDGGATPAERIAFAYCTTLSRQPTAEETAIVNRALDKHLARYTQDAAAAKAVLGNGDSKPRAGLPAPEVAAWTLVANLILNLDETLTRN